MAICAHCGSALIEDKTRFCSPECESRYLYLRKEKKRTQSRKKSKIHRQDCEVCGIPLVGRQTRFCSITCKNEFHQSYVYQKERGLRRKLELVQMLGGKCISCGYDKNLAALSFHHQDRVEKSHELDIRSLSNRKIEAVMEEVEKCILLCANCHMETHYPDLDMSKLEGLANKLKSG